MDTIDNPSKMSKLKIPLHSNSSPVTIPGLGFGTFEASPGEEAKSQNAILEALKAGYRFIDTAALYGSEYIVGKAIAASRIPRDEITVCTKFWNQYHQPEDVKRAMDESLARLGLDHVDIFLMHWPIAFKRTDDFKELTHEDGKPIIDQYLSTNHEPTWRAMEELVDAGKARAIGVSNFNVPQLEALLSYARIKPCCNQVESHPWLPETHLLDFCQKNGITFMAYSPLGSQTGPAAMHVIDRFLMEDETIVAAAQQLHVAPAQVILAWAIQRGTIPIPKSATISRIRANISLPTLPSDVLQKINKITESDPAKTKRFVNFDKIWNSHQFD